MKWLLNAWKIGSGFVSAYKSWFIIGLATIILTTVWIYVKSAERAKERLAVTEYQLGQALDAAKANNEAVEACEAVNKANADAAVKALKRATEAELRLAAAGAKADSKRENINREASNLRAVGLACPAIDRRYRQWMLDNA